jgi:folate-binding protein YgfZ
VPDALAPAQILEISGLDGRAFAHAQFTSNVDALVDGQWQWSAWLDPAGRVRNVFALLRSREDRLLAWLPRGDSASMAQRLSMYVLRSKVRMQPLAGRWLLDLHSAGGGTPEQAAEIWLLDLPGSPPRHAAIIDCDTEPPLDADRLQAWVREDIAAGLPWIGSETAEEFTPQALGLERLGAISLGKGCYPGQEIVARLHYRGGNKRTCVPLKLECDLAPAPGAVIEIAGTASLSGRILYAAQPQDGICAALGVLPINLPEDARMQLASGCGVILAT